MDVHYDRSILRVIEPDDSETVVQCGPIEVAEFRRGRDGAADLAVLTVVSGKEVAIVGADARKAFDVVIDAWRTNPDQVLVTSDRNSETVVRSSLPPAAAEREALLAVLPAEPEGAKQESALSSESAPTEKESFASCAPGRDFLGTAAIEDPSGLASRRKTRGAA